MEGAVTGWRSDVSRVTGMMASLRMMQHCLIGLFLPLDFPWLIGKLDPCVRCVRAVAPEDGAPFWVLE